MPNKGWSWIKEFDAKLAFEEASAHEIGHDILNYIGGGSYSVKHKGTSSFITQKPIKNNPCPSHGEIDLMNYFSRYGVKNYYSRVVIAEEDLKGLINLIKNVIE